MFILQLESVGLGAYSYSHTDRQ